MLVNIGASSLLLRTDQQEHFAKLVFDPHDMAAFLAIFLFLPFLSISPFPLTLVISISTPSPSLFILLSFFPFLSPLIHSIPRSPIHPAIEPLLSLSLSTFQSLHVSYLIFLSSSLSPITSHPPFISHFPFSLSFLFFPLLSSPFLALPSTLPLSPSFSPFLYPPSTLTPPFSFSLPFHPLLSSLPPSPFSFPFPLPPFTLTSHFHFPIPSSIFPSHPHFLFFT